MVVEYAVLRWHTRKNWGFSSAKREERLEEKRENYAVKKITIRENHNIFAHAGRCTDGLASVFCLKEEPWIHPNAGSADEVIATIQQCLSRALSYSVEDVEHADR